MLLVRAYEKGRGKRIEAMFLGVAGGHFKTHAIAVSTAHSRFTEHAPKRIFQRIALIRYEGIMTGLTKFTKRIEAPLEFFVRVDIGIEVIHRKGMPFSRQFLCWIAGTGTAAGMKQDIHGHLPSG